MSNVKEVSDKWVEMVVYAAILYLLNMPIKGGKAVGFKRRALTATTWFNEILLKYDRELHSMVWNALRGDESRLVDIFAVKLGLPVPEMPFYGQEYEEPVESLKEV